MLIEPYVTQSQLVGLAVLSSVAGVVWLARRDGAPVLSALAFFGLAGVLAVVFGRVGAVIIEGVGLDALASNWSGVLNPFAPAGYSSFGALFGAGLAVAALSRVESATMRNRILDVTVPPGIAALAIARIGCLFEGCDYGAPGSVSWAVRFPAGHAVWREHVQDGLVTPSELVSMGIHPFPLYIAIPTLVLVIGLAVAKFRRAGVRASAVILSYLAVRFVAEFFRAPDVMSWGWFNVNHLAAVAAFAVIVVWARYHTIETE